MTPLPLDNPSFAMRERIQDLKNDFDIQSGKRENIGSFVIKEEVLSTLQDLNQASSSASAGLSGKKIENIVNTAIPKIEIHPEGKEKTNPSSPFERTGHDVNFIIIRHLDKKSRANFMTLYRESAQEVRLVATRERKELLEELKDKMNRLMTTLDELSYQSEIKELNHFIKNPDSPFNQDSLTFQKLDKLELENFVHQKVYEIFKNKIDSDDPKLTSNPILMLIVMTQDGCRLRDASDELRNNPEIVKAAVTQNGFMLRHASDELRNNPEIVKAAVTQNGLALRYASPKLKNNLEIVKAAVTQNRRAATLASPEIQNHSEIKQILDPNRVILTPLT